MPSDTSFLTEGLENSHDTRRLAEEQAALRRVAVLVAGGATAAELFAAVAEECARIAGIATINIGRFEGDEAVVVASVNQEAFPVGSRWAIDGPSVHARIRETGKPARIDDYAHLPGAIAAAVRASGVRSGVGVPIVVDGKIWGAIAAGLHGTEPAKDVEQRLADFTELVASAISRAQAHDDIVQLASQQAALRRLATLVAQAVPADDFFKAVVAEMTNVLGVDGAVVRYDPDEMFTLLALAQPELSDVFVAGSRWPLDQPSTIAMVHATGRPARIDDYADLPGEHASLVRDLGIQSSMAVPVIVEGRAWGALTVVLRADAQAWPPNIESQLGEFTELIGTAIAGTAAQERVRGLADEQAALRRVATLVAEGVPQAELFAAVTAEVAHVFSAIEPSILATVIRFDPGPECVIVGGSRPSEGEPIGSRWAPKKLYVSTRVLDTGRSARISEADLDADAGPDEELLRRRGVLFQAGCPVVVEGRVWGAMTLNARNPLPPSIDGRLESFTELIATAIANAESRDALARLADEQAALRRVASLVARGAASSEIFDAVCSETGRVLEAPGVNLWEYTGEARGVIVAGNWTSRLGDLPHGEEFALVPDTSAGRIRKTGKPARTDGYDGATSELASRVRGFGIRSSIGAPVIVEGELWGALIALTDLDEPFPAGAEDHLVRFTDLIATAISNAQARTNLRTAAAEQAALRRVATLVARGVPQREVFDAVAREVGLLFDADLTVLGRYEGDSSIALGSWSTSREHLMPEGTRVKLGGHNLLSEVAATGRPARLDGYDEATGPAASVARRLGARSSIAAPIVDDGRVWGVMLLASTLERPFPPDSEHQLAAFTELIATSVGNAEAHTQLVDSRARIVAAGDEARRRIERNLHDGTQQQLLALGLELQTVRAAVPPDLQQAHDGLDRMEREIEGVLADVRELSRGLHPALLSRAGLVPAVRVLARRSPIPVEVDIDLDDRLPELLETTVYFVVAETVTNAIKHSSAEHISISVSRNDSSITALVSDDGIGGAALNGSGLTGLVDRVHAAGGRLTLQSPPGEGTKVSIQLPLHAA